MSTLPENDRLSGPFVAIAAQTAFDADFPLIDAPSDAAGTSVFMRRTRAGVNSDLALGAFTVSGPNENGFTASLATPALAGDVYWIVGRQRQARLRAHPLGGAVRTPTLEDDAREGAARAQEARRDLDRTVAAPIGETGQALPPAATRAGRLFVGGPSGEPLAMLEGSEQVVTLNALGQAVPMDLVHVFGAIGTDLFDDGLWEPGDDPSSNDDGVWG